MKTIIYNAHVVMANKIIDGGYLAFENGVISDLGEGIPKLDGEVIDAKGLYLSAGFIDIHCHGGADCDFSDGSVEAYLIPAEFHVVHGTTALVPTVTTSQTEDIINSLECFFMANSSEHDGARLLGIHMEGPYISKTQAGAQDVRYIREPQEEDYEYILKKANGSIIRWTFAPEVRGSDKFSDYLKNKGIIPSIGHSDALYEDVKRFYDKGTRLLTHFYSSMSSITRVDGYRKTGVVESGYLLDDMNVEVIADGHHLPPELLEMIYKFKGSDRIALVTDAMRGAGMPDGKTVLGKREGGLDCIIEGGVAKLPDRSAFAGSVCTANSLVRTMYKTVGVPLDEAVKMITYTPARIMGLDSKMGSLKKGFCADLVLFDDDINIHRTIINGKTVFQRSEL